MIFALRMVIVDSLFMYILMCMILIMKKYLLFKAIGMVWRLAVKHQSVKHEYIKYEFVCLVEFFCDGLGLI